jgi:hypothetical protein
VRYPCLEREQALGPAPYGAYDRAKLSVAEALCLGQEDMALNHPLRRKEDWREVEAWLTSTTTVDLREWLRTSTVGPALRNLW